MSALLSITNLSKSFGAVIVSDNTSFDIHAGEVVGILGPNGAGKTSLFNLITGSLQADSGQINYRNEDITRTSASYRCKRGMARSFQVPQPFVGMTVFENTLVGATQGAGLKGAIAHKHVLAVLEQTGLIDSANVKAGTLTLLERKRLELARALSTKPSLLLLDEIAGGLTDAECKALISTIKHVHAGGATIVWIEHVVHALLAVAQKLIVLNFGKIIAQGNPVQILASEQVKEIYLGVGAGATDV